MRRERAITACLSKRRYYTMLAAGLQARGVREGNAPWPDCSSDKRMVPYCCPKCGDYHIGHNHAGSQKVIDIQFRMRLGLRVDKKDLDFIGFSGVEDDYLPKL